MVPGHVHSVVRPVLLAILITMALPAHVQGEGSAPPEAAEVWLADIDALDQFIRQYHPDPFYRTGEGSWLDGLNAAREQVVLGASDAVITTSLMSAVARLGDGHTRLEPTGIAAFNYWLPLRFYAFDDGVFVTVAADPFTSLIGQRLVRVGETAVDQVLVSLETITSGDNVFQLKEGSAALLSNTGLLTALGGISDPAAPVNLGFEDSSGVQAEHSISTVSSWYSVNYRNWGELFGPPFEPFDVYKTPFHDGKSPMAYREMPNETDAPFFASRKPFWSRLDAGESILTFQFNYFADVGDIGWDEFRSQMWQQLDRAQPDRVIIDLRYNFGGDGGMVRAFINELLARPGYANGNRLVVLTGRQTFSAAVMLVAALKDHTDAVFVGEPAGAPLNQYGDPTTITLPSGRLELVVSTLYWQLGHPADRAVLIPVNLCVPLLSTDYFAGVDLAWNTAVEVNIEEIRPLESNCG